VLNVQLPGQSITGLADPLFEIGAYFKPAPGLTLGYVNVPSIPVGSNELSSHFWSDTSLIVWNYHVGKFGFNGTFAAGFSSTQHAGGKDTEIGDSFTHKQSLALWYYKGIDGDNVVKTNAAYLFYTRAF
jgi:hypothetical protein